MTNEEIARHAQTILDSTSPLNFRKADRLVWLFCLVHCARPASVRGSNPLFVVSGQSGVGKTTLIEHSAALLRRRWPVYPSSFLSDNEEFQKTLGGSLLNCAEAGDAVASEDLPRDFSYWGCERLAAYCSARSWRVRQFGRSQSEQMAAKLSLWATTNRAYRAAFIPAMRKRVVEIRLMPPGSGSSRARRSESPRGLCGWKWDQRPIVSDAAIEALQLLSEQSLSSIQKALKGPDLPQALACAIQGVA